MPEGAIAHPARHHEQNAQGTDEFLYSKRNWGQETDEEQGRSHTNPNPPFHPVKIPARDWECPPTPAFS